MRKFFITTGIILLIAGIGILLFLFISNQLYIQQAAKRCNLFDNQIIVDTKKRLDKNGRLTDGQGNIISDYPVLFRADVERLQKDSIEYNKELKDNQFDMLVSNLSYEKPALSLSKYGIYDGVFGYIECSEINLKLPIYLGTGNNHMNYGAAHLTCTSLPIGGQNTNCVLAAHTGYIGKIMFDFVKNLSPGDTVKIKNYWSTLYYEVSKIKTVKPCEIEDIYIEEGKDLLTLVTCNYNGSKRYVIKCERK